MRWSEIIAVINNAIKQITATEVQEIKHKKKKKLKKRLRKKSFLLVVSPLLRLLVSIDPIDTLLLIVKQEYSSLFFVSYLGTKRCHKYIVHVLCVT
jgi:hypothetical protein